MDKPWSYVRGWWGRNSSQGKSVSGYELDITMCPRDAGDLERGHRVDAVYIPTNERDLLRQDVALAMGLDDRDGTVVDIHWKLSNEPYKCANKFVVKSELPRGVIFGRQHALNSIPKYPNIFERGSRRQYSESHDFSKKRTKSWGRIKETLSWGSSASGEKKDKPRRLSFLHHQRKSQPSPDTLGIHAVSGTNAQAHEVEKAHNAQGGVAHQRITSNQNVPDGGANIESTAKISTEISTENETRMGQTLGSNSLMEDLSEPRSLPDETKISEGKHEREIGVMDPEPDALDSPVDLKDRALDSRFDGGLGLEPRSVETSGLETSIGKHSPQEKVESAVDLAAIVVEDTKRNSAMTKANQPSKSGGDREKGIFILHSGAENLDLEDESVHGPPRTEIAQSSRREIETRRRNASPKPRSVRQAQQGFLELENDNVSQPSTTYPESSSEMALNPPATPDSPLSQGNFPTFTRFPGPVLDNTLQNYTSRAPVKDNTAHASRSDRLLIQQEARAKIQARKRGKAPKMRRVKTPPTKAAANKDLTSAPGASEEWTYDASANAYYQIDSDTGSYIWYSDADSEDSDN